MLSIYLIDGRAVAGQACNIPKVRYPVLANTQLRPRATNIGNPSELKVGFGSIGICEHNESEPISGSKLQHQVQVKVTATGKLRFNEVEL